jgi:transcriptional regulator with XRE-family HTH domain
VCLDAKRCRPDDGYCVLASSKGEGGAETIGVRVRRLRHAKGLTQRELASRALSGAYVSRIESGERLPSVRVIRLLARRLGVTPEYLETGGAMAAVEALELRLGDAELRLRLGDHSLAARHALQAVLGEAELAGERELAVRAQIGLGLSALATGSQRDAAHYLATAVASPLITPATHANVYISLSKALRFLGRADEAALLLGAALDELDARTPAAGGIALRLATYLSYALTDLGKFDRARSVLEALDIGDAVDPHRQVTLHWSLARLAYMEGQARSALREIRRAIVLLDHTEDSLELARAHLFAAEVHLWAGNLPAAEHHIAHAGRLESLAADARDLGALHSCQALAHARRGESEYARRLIERAHQELADAPAEQGLLWLAQALTETRENQLDAAARSFELAIAALTTSNMYREAAAVCREWSHLLSAAGRNEDADRTATRAARLEKASKPTVAIQHH